MYDIYEAQEKDRLLKESMAIKQITQEDEISYLAWFYRTQAYKLLGILNFREYLRAIDYPVGLNRVRDLIKVHETYTRNGIDLSELKTKDTEILLRVARFMGTDSENEWIEYLKNLESKEVKKLLSLSTG